MTLRALEGEPLRDPMVRRTVVAAAHAIAERNGVRLVRLDSDARRVTVTLETSRLAAIGFAAELRRVTTEWHRKRSGASTLWGDPATEDDGPEDRYGLFSPPPA